MGRQTKKDHRSGSLTRKQGTRNVKQSFLIVCEGVRTEPDYFKAFRMTTATVKAIGQAMNTISLVNKAISIRDTEQKKKHYYDHTDADVDLGKLNLLPITKKNRN